MNRIDCTFFKAVGNLAQMFLNSERISHTTTCLKIMYIVRAESQLKYVQKCKLGNERSINFLNETAIL